LFVTVKFFASYREMLGEDQLLLELDDGYTVGDILDILKDRYPVLKEQGYMPLTACNLKHVSKRHALEDGDEVAIFPPVSGG
jgi:molybdopterin synthase sulfur carrier subunit